MKIKTRRISKEESVEEEERSMTGKLKKSQI